MRTTETSRTGGAELPASREGPAEPEAAEQSCPSGARVRRYKSASGEKVIKIENLIEAVTSQPEKVCEYVRVKRLGSDQAIADRCVVCDGHLLDNLFTVFCSKCLFSEDELVSANRQT